jgi:hypothetical protein
MTMSKVIIAREEIEIDTGAQAVSSNKTVTLSAKEKLTALSEEKRQELFDKITRPKLTKFDVVSMTLSDEDKLDDTYNTGIQVLRFKNHLDWYDCTNVCNIVEFDPTDPTQLTGVTWNLFKDYSSIMERRVAQSNKWFRTYPKKEYYRDNLQLTLETLENSCTEALWEKVCETHDEYPSNEREGPLAILIMMKMIQNHNDLGAQYLTNTVKNLKISSFEGEKVPNLVSLIRRVHHRLKMVKTNLPEEFLKWVLNILHTSTVTEFNSAFAHLQLTIKVVDPMISGRLKPMYPEIDDML